MATHDEGDEPESGRPSGKTTARALGVAAAAGLGAVAAVELLDAGVGAGETHSGDGPRGPRSAPGPVQSSPHGTSGDASVQLDTAGQAGTAGDAGKAAAGDPPAASGSASGSASTAHPGQPGATSHPGPSPAHAKPAPLIPGPHGALAANPATNASLLTGPAVPTAASATSLAGSSPGPARPTAVPVLPSGTVPAGGTPSATATSPKSEGPWSVLYDSAGAPVGMVDAAGAFSAFPGTPAASASATSPLNLYDASGHQVSTYDGASRLMPLATAGQSPWLTGIPPAYATPSAQAMGSGAPVTSVNPPGQQQVVTQVQYTPVPLPDSQVNQNMLNDSPAARQDAIRQFLQSALNDPGTTPAEKAAIQQVLDGSIPNLPDSFYAHGSYTYKDDNGKVTTLNTLQAAATVAMLQEEFSHFKVYIQDLSDTAGKLYAKGDDIQLPAMSLGLKFQAVSKMWDTLFADAGNSSDPNIQAAQANFMQVKNTLFGGSIDDPTTMSCRITKGNIPITAQAIRDKADQLYEIAAKYVSEEQTNLSYFHLQADDPRPAWEKARFTVVNGNPVDNAQTGKYPPGYFDPSNPGSPFYNGQGPQ